MSTLRETLMLFFAALPLAVVAPAYAQNSGSGSGSTQTGTGAPPGSTGMGLNTHVQSLSPSVGRGGQSLGTQTANQPGFLNTTANSAAGQTRVPTGFLGNTSAVNRAGAAPGTSLGANVQPLGTRTTTTAVRRAPRVSESTPIFSD